MKSLNSQPGALAPFTLSARRYAGLFLLTFLLAAGLFLRGGVCRADTPASKTDSFLQRVLETKPTSGWTSVIVKLGGPLTVEQQNQLKSLHAYIYRHFDFIHSIALRIPARNLARLAQLPFALRLSADGPVEKKDAFTTESSLATTAWQAPYNLSGEGVTVAIVDSGVNNVPDFQQVLTPLAPIAVNLNSQLIASVNFADANSGDTNDSCGHGSHVAGIVAGNGASSSGPLFSKTFYGIARKANLVSVRALDSQGQGTVSSVIAGIQWVIANRTRYNIRVMNLSLGHPVGESYTTDPLCQIVEQAWKSGIVVVCAAGNDGRLNANVTPGVTDNEGYGTDYGSINSPGNDPYVITVGAMKSMDGKRADDRIATYSSRGPSRIDIVLKPDIVAPGNRVISVVSEPDNYLMTTYAATNLIPLSDYSNVASLLNSKQASNQYFCLSGTSMATPVISGAAALLLQANPKLTPDTIKARLMFSADKWLGANGVCDPSAYGAGYINIPAALNCALIATQSALSPTLSEDASGHVYIDASVNFWGTGIDDLRLLWGESAIYDASFNTLTASQVIWGKSVWSDMVIWGKDTAAADLSDTAIYGE